MRSAANPTRKHGFYNGFVESRVGILSAALRTSAILSLVQIPHGERLYPNFSM